MRLPGPQTPENRRKSKRVAKVGLTSAANPLYSNSPSRKWRVGKSAKSFLPLKGRSEFREKRNTAEHNNITLLSVVRLLGTIMSIIAL